MGARRKNPWPRSAAASGRRTGRVADFELLPVAPTAAAESLETVIDLLPHVAGGCLGRRHEAYANVSQAIAIGPLKSFGAVSN